MKIAIAGIAHETNTYCKEQTRIEDFRIMRGDKLYRMRGTESQVGGALAACDELGLTPVPIMAAWTQPSGTIAFDAYSAMKEEILDGISAAMPLDGIFLDLHGAGVVDGQPDLEGDLASAIREIAPDIPVTAAFDLHGNITQLMADHLDGVFTCHQYPHIDTHERARDAIHLIHRMNTEGLTTALRVVNVPMLMPTTTTFHGPGKAMLDHVLEMTDADKGIINISWFHGFPYTDIPHVGSHVVVTATDEKTAGETADRIARELWQRREDFRPTSLSADEAVQAAKDATAWPVVINETSDNCGGGTPGDGTHLLKAMLDAKLENACFGFLVDPEVASQAHQAGVGASITVELGGKYDDLHGDTLTLDVYVKALHDGRCVMTAMGKGSPINYGKMARLVIDDFDIIVASNRSQTFDTEPFIAVGIDVLKKDYVALKSSNHFRAGFEPIAGTVITADPPGLTTHHVEIFPRQNTTTPLWPIDDKASFG